MIKSYINCLFKAHCDCRHCFLHVPGALTSFLSHLFEFFSNIETIWNDLKHSLRAFLRYFHLKKFLCFAQLGIPHNNQVAANLSTAQMFPLPKVGGLCFPKCPVSLRKNKGVHSKYKYLHKYTINIQLQKATTCHLVGF